MRKGNGKMKIQKNAVTWNLGDTSFRRKHLLDDYKVLLELLSEYNDEVDNKWTEVEQVGFYQKIQFESNLLKGKVSNKQFNKQAQRARTYTNALNKIGLCTEKTRVVTPVGEEFLHLDMLTLDKFEKKLNVAKENTIFLRQLCKLRIFDCQHKNNFAPFLIILSFLQKYDRLPMNHFSQISQSLLPGQNYVEILRGYQEVVEDRITFKNYLDTFFKEADDFSKESFLKEYLYSDVVNFSIFKQIFKNRKTSDSIRNYYEFYMALLDYNLKNSDISYMKLKQTIENKVNVTAFGTNQLFTVKGIKNYKGFNEKNSSSPLLSQDSVAVKQYLYECFDECKKADVMREYSDMTLRTFNLSGVLSFDNGYVNISKVYLQEILALKNIRVYFDKKMEYADYEKEIQSNNLSIMKILSINELENKELDDKIEEKYNLNGEVDATAYIAKLEREKFHKYIEVKYPRENVMELLKLFQERNDKEIQKRVTDNATIPTIFEYVIGIAWYYISDKELDLQRSLKLSFDGTGLPLSHAVGGNGDIEIEYANHNLLIEATLMDINTQKRGELEPVIRHAVNFSCESKPKPTFTVFIANELDNNVVNIFRLCNNLELEYSKVKGNYVEDIKIVSFTTGELISFLQKEINYVKIFEAMGQEFRKSNGNIQLGWRTNFFEKIIQ